MTAIYEKLKVLREKTGFRQSQIADYLGVTQTYISKVETGERNLTVEQLEKIVNLYGYGLDVFSTAEDEVDPIQFAFRAQDVNQDDLSAIADINRIVINCRLMAKLLEESNA